MELYQEFETYDFYLPDILSTTDFMARILLALFLNPLAGASEGASEGRPSDSRTERLSRLDFLDIFDAFEGECNLLTVVFMLPIFLAFAFVLQLD